MLLAIDVGNTNVVFGLYDGDTLLDVKRVETGADFTLSDLFSEKIDCAIVSSVVPDMNARLRAALPVEPVFVTRDQLDLRVDLDRPDEVGADRLVNAVAVKAFYCAPAVVIDFGTATTFDVIDADGAYSGGVIAPGINLSVETLARAAAQLPRIEVRKPARVIGKSTVEAMQSGLFWGYAGLIEGTLARIEAEMGAKPFVLATGGLAPLFCEHMDVIDAVDRKLTLKGLLHIHKSSTQDA